MRSRRERWVQIHSIWSAWTFGEAYSTVAGRLRMILSSREGSHTSVTASQISRANSSSVLVKLSGEYSRRRRVPAATSGRVSCFINFTASVAIFTTAGLSAPNT